MRRGLFATAAIGLAAASAPAQDVGQLYQEGAAAFADGLFEAAARPLGELTTHHPDFSRLGDAVFLLALSYTHVGRHSEALDLLRTFTRRFPESTHNGTIDYWRGSVLLALGRPEEALSMAERQIAGETAAPAYRRRALLLRAAALEATGQAAAAAKVYIDLVPSSPAEEAADALFRVGQLQYGLGRFVDAVAAFERLIVELPGTERAPLALFALGDALLAAGRRGEAEARFVRYLDLFPDASLIVDAQERLAAIYAESGRVAEAFDLAGRALRSRPSGSLRARLHQVRGAAALELGETDAAIESLTAAVAAGGGLPADAAQWAAFNLAVAHLRAGDSGSALLWLEIAQKGPDDDVAARAALDRAFLLVEAGELSAGADALSHFAETHSGHPRLGEALQVLAQAREALGENRAALKTWDRLVGVFTRNGVRDGTALLRAADAAAAGGDDSRALSLLANVRRQQPDSIAAAEATYRIGRIYAGRGEHDRAAGFFAEIALAAPEVAARARLGLAAARFNAGKHQEAAALLEDSVVDVWEPYRLLALGRVLYRLGDPRAAAAAFTGAMGAADPGVAADAAYLIGAADFHAGEYQAARDAYYEFTIRFPDSQRLALAFYRAGVSEVLLQRPDAGLEFLRRALQAAVESAPERVGAVDLTAEILFELVRSALLADRLQNATAALGQLVARAPGGLLAAEARLMHGAYLASHGARREGLASLVALADERPDVTAGLRARLAAATAAEALREYRLAAAHFWRAILAGDGSAEFEPAIAGLRRLVEEVGPAAAAAYYSDAVGEPLPDAVRARILYEYATLIFANAPAAAAAALERAASSLRPGVRRDDAYFRLAEHYVSIGRLEEAEAAYRAVVFADAPSARQAEAHLRMALLSAASVGPGSAAPELVSVALRYPDQKEVSAEALFWSVKFLVEQGDIEQAQILRERLRSQYGDSEWASRADHDRRSSSSAPAPRRRRLPTVSSKSRNSRLPRSSAPLLPASNSFPPGSIRVAADPASQAHQLAVAAPSAIRMPV